MIHFNWTNPNSEKVEGVLNVFLDSEAAKYFKEEQLPLIVTHKNLAGKTVWFSKLWPDCFSSHLLNTYTTCEIVDYTGKKLINWEWNPFIHGDFAHQFFEIWAQNNPGSNGIAIGTHDGMTGEWVGPVKEGKLKATLIEASSPQFEELQIFYQKKPWITCQKSLVTPDGLPVTFYEGGFGFTNSTRKDIIDQYVEEAAISSTKMNSISINDLIENVSSRGKVKWLHIDTEGLDHELVLAIHEHLLPDLLIFESLHLDEENSVLIHSYLQSKNYGVVKSGWNTICIKN